MRNCNIFCDYWNILRVRSVTISSRNIEVANDVFHAIFRRKNNNLHCQYNTQFVMLSSVLAYGLTVDLLSICFLIGIYFLNFMSNEGSFICWEMVYNASWITSELTDYL